MKMSAKWRVHSTTASDKGVLNMFMFPIVILAGMLYLVSTDVEASAPKAKQAKEIVVKGKPSKSVVLKDRAGRKKNCKIVIDKNTKKEYIVCN